MIKAKKSRSTCERERVKMTPTLKRQILGEIVDLGLLEDLGNSAAYKTLAKKHHMSWTTIKSWTSKLRTGRLHVNPPPPPETEEVESEFDDSITPKQAWKSFHNILLAPHSNRRKV